MIGRLKQIFSVFMAAVVMSTTANMTVFAAESTETRVKWEGWEKANNRAPDFDIWDGTSYDISWAVGADGIEGTEDDPYKGTEDDPYIIDSAADLIGLSHLTQNKENFAANGLNANKIDIPNDVSLMSTADHYALKRNEVYRDFDTWYKYTMKPLDIVIKQIKYDITPYTIRYTKYVDGAEIEDSEDFIYATNIRAILQITDKELSVDISDIIEAIIINGNTDYRYCLTPVLNPDNIYTYDEYSAHRRISEEDIEYLCKEIESDIKITANVSDSLVKLFYEYKDYNRHFIAEHLIGYTTELGLPAFPTVSAINAAGEKVTINANNYGEYFLPDSISAGTVTYDHVNLDYIEPKYINKLTEFNIYGKHQTLSDAFSESFTKSQDVKYINAIYAYYKPNNSVESDPKYMTNLASAPLAEISYTADYSWNPENRILTITVIRKSSNSNIAEVRIPVEIPIDNKYTQLNKITLDFTINKNQITITPICNFAGYYEGVTGDNITDILSVDTIGTVNTPTIIGNTVEINPNEYTFMGTSYMLPTTADSIIKHNLYNRDEFLPTFATESMKDPSFNGKYIKLAKDIDISTAINSYLFPILQKNVSAGLACDFNLDEHIIRTSYTLFGTICTNGRIHNGTIVSKATGDDISAWNANKSTSYWNNESNIYLNRTSQIAIINENFGIVEDIQFMSNTVFCYDDVISTGMTAIVSNNGLINNCKLYADWQQPMTLVNQNVNKINNSQMMLIDTENVTPSWMPYIYFVYNNLGTVDKCKIDSDSNVLWNNPKSNIRLYGIGFNQGKISNFEFSDFSIDYFWEIKGINNNGINSYSGGIIDNLTSNMNVIQDDFSLNISDCRIIVSNTNGIIKNSKINYNGYICRYHAQINNTNGIIENSVINITTHDNHTDYVYETFLDGKLVNCKINLTFPEKRSYGKILNTIVDCDIDIDDISNVYTSYDVPVVAKIAKNCKIKINKLGKLSFPDVDNCIIDIGELNYANSNTWSSVPNQALFVKANNSDIIIHSINGTFYDLFSDGYGEFWNNPKQEIKNCRFSVTFSKDIIGKRGNYLYNNNVVLKNCELYYFFDKDATGVLNTFNTDRSYRSNAIMQNCLVYFAPMPSGIVFTDRLLISTSGQHYGESLEDSFGNTIIAPHINVDLTKISESSTASYDDQYGFSITEDKLMPVNTYIDASVQFMNTKEENGKPLFVAAVSIGDINSQSVATNNTWNINVFDEENKILDVPVYGYAGGAAKSRYNEHTRINSTILRSNSPSSESALLQLPTRNRNPEFEGFTNGLCDVVLRNCVLDLPNSLDYSPDVTSGKYPGFVKVTSECESNTQQCAPYEKALSGWLQRKGLIGLIRCYVPEGKSWAHTDLDAQDGYDTFNIVKTLDSNIESPSNQFESVIKTLVSQQENVEMTQDIDKDMKSQGVSYYDPNGDSSGELAYKLDNGGSIRRTYQWSVADSEDYIVNSFTNEKLYSFPEKTIISTLKLPERCIHGSGLKPVFKTTIQPAEKGYVELEGIGHTLSNHDEADDIYAKQDDYIVSDIKPADDNIIFVYATQKLGTGYPARIPNTPLTMTTRASDDGTYTIMGYKQQGLDTVITPIFKTARNINIDITNSEHGTVVPSAYISAEGEKIEVTLDTEEGYTITNLKLDGNPLTTSSFFMPDADVTITGECIPFEGGITSFKLFGFDGVIDQIEKTIKLTVPKTAYITNALPEIEWVGDRIDPSTTERVDFSNSVEQPVEYTVYYGDNQSITYLVTVEQGEYTMRIYDFVVNGTHGEINQALKTISIKAPANTDLQHIIPDDIVYSAERIDPVETTERNFMTSQVYTLYTTGMSPVSYVVTVIAADESEAEITEFKVSGYEGDINQEEDLITLKVPEGINFNSIAPDSIKYVGKKIEANKIDKNDLSDKATYTVTAQNGDTREYTVETKYISDNEKHIDKFVLAGVEGKITDISETEGTIEVIVPVGTTLSGIKPDILEYTGKSIYPRVDQEQDFTAPVKYTVVATDNSEKTYTVTVKTDASNEAILYEFDILGFKGVVDQEKKTVTVRFPYGVDISNTPPSNVVISKFATINPTADTAQNFTEDKEYAVTAQDGKTSNKYTVHCIVEDKPIELYNVIVDETKNGTVSAKPTQAEENTTIDVVATPDNGYKLSKLIVDGNAVDKKDLTIADNSTKYSFAMPAHDVHVKAEFVKVEVPKDQTAEITYFEILDTPGVIDQDEGKITITLPSKVKPEDLKDIDPVIKWKGETIAPDENSKEDFNNPPDYTVTAEDPSIKKTYDIIVKILDDTAKITHFEILDTPGDIDEDEKKIVIELPPDTKPEDLKDIDPIIRWEGESITPDDDEPQDFNNPPDYTVTAEDPEVKNTYDIIVKIKDKEPLDKTAEITYFEILNTPGDIDQDNKIITINLPAGTKPEDLLDIDPVIVWKGDSIDPGENEHQDFDKSITYTVTAEDPTVKVPYDVIVTITPSDKTAIITYFEILGVPGVIDQTKHTIDITLPWTTKPEDLYNVIPSITWIGKEIVPSELEANNFSKPITYTVIAEDDSIKVPYLVTTTIADKPDDKNPDTGIHFNRIEADIAALSTTLSVCITSSAVKRKKNKDKNKDNKE